MITGAAAGQAVAVVLVVRRHALAGSERFWKIVGASNSEWRSHHQAEPWMSFVPPLVLMLTTEPMVWPIRGVERRGLHLELADGGLRRRKRHAHIGAVGEGIGDAVDGELVVEEAAAVGGKLRRRIVERRLAQAHVGAVDRARREQRELHGVAGEERQFQDAPLVHYLAEGRVGGGEQRRLGCDFDRFGDIADGEGHVHFDRVVDAHLHVFADEFLEAGGFRGDVVHAGSQVRHE